MIKAFATLPHLVLLFAVLLGTQASCLVTTQAVQLNEAGQDILLSATIPPDAEAFVEVVSYELTGSIFTSRKRLKQRLLKKARENNCDAVFNTQFKTTFIWPQALGTGVRYLSRDQ